jgi:hypothetical protein
MYVGAAARTLGDVQEVGNGEGGDVLIRQTSPHKKKDWKFSASRVAICLRAEKAEGML